MILVVYEKISYKGHRYSPEFISHAVWLYGRHLSLRSVEEILLKQGIEVSYENIRQWVMKFGSPYTYNLRNTQHKAVDIWHLDEVRLVIKGDIFWLWRAVDQHGIVLEELMPDVEHWKHKALSNRVENSHLVFRKCERSMQKYRSPSTLQKFVPFYSALRNLFSIPNFRQSANQIRYNRLKAFDI